MRLRRIFYRERPYGHAYVEELDPLGGIETVDADDIAAVYAVLVPLKPLNINEDEPGGRLVRRYGNYEYVSPPARRVRT